MATSICFPYCVLLIFIIVYYSIIQQFGIKQPNTLIFKLYTLLSHIKYITKL